MHDEQTPDTPAEPTIGETPDIAPQQFALGYKEGDDFTGLRTALRCASSKLQHVQQTFSDQALTEYVAALDPALRRFIASTAVEIVGLNRENFEQNVEQQRTALQSMAEQVENVVIPRLTES